MSTNESVVPAEFRSAMLQIDELVKRQSCGQTPVVWDEPTVLTNEHGEDQHYVSGSFEAVTDTKISMDLRRDHCGAKRMLLEIRIDVDTSDLSHESILSIVSECCSIGVVTAVVDRWDDSEFVLTGFRRTVFVEDLDCKFLGEVILSLTSRLSLLTLSLGH